MVSQPPKPSKPDLKKATPTKKDRDAKVPATKGPIAKSGAPSPKPTAPKAPPPSVGRVFAAPIPAAPPPMGPQVSAVPPDMQQQYGRLDGRALARAILGQFAQAIAQPGQK